MLWPEPHDILAAASSVQQDGEREPRLRSNRVPLLVGLNLVARPRVVAGRYISDRLHARGWVVWRLIGFDCSAE